MTEKGDARVGDDGREWRRWPKGGTMAEREGGGAMAERRTMAENGYDDREGGRC